MPLPDLVPREFLERAERGRVLVDAATRVRVLCHYDPDGTTSAGILGRALLRRGKQFHATLSTVLDAALAARVKEEDVELVIVADMGSGQLDLIEGLGVPAIVLDHHRVLRDSEKVVHLNPLLWGGDGVKGACGATMSFLFSLALDDANWDLVGLALAGMIGDRQHAGGLEGWNAGVVAEGVTRRLLRRERALLLRETGLATAIAASHQPYFVGMSGRPEAATAFLQGLGLDPRKRPRELTVGEAKRLSSALAAHLVGQGANPEAVEMLVDDRFWVEGESLHADELTAYVNACCRLGEEALGLALCLGDKESFSAAEDLRTTFEAQLIASLQKIETGDVHAMKHVQFFYHDSATVAGSVAGIAMPYFLDQARPVIGLATTDGQTKVSSRGTKYLVAKGLDLATAMHDAASSVGGVGGGHTVAAGATVPKGKEREFLGRVDAIVGTQLTPREIEGGA